MVGAPRYGKLGKILHYFHGQWLDNDELPLKSWNVCYGHRHGTNNPVEGWNSKFNRAVGIHKYPERLLFAQNIKGDAQQVLGKIVRGDLGFGGNKRKGASVQRDLNVAAALQNYYSDRDLEKCLNNLSYLAKLG